MQPPRFVYGLWVLLLGALLTLSSCSLSFGPKWREARKGGPKAGVEGAWKGSWHSDASGHHGDLRCIVGPAKNGQGDHDFTYHATWLHLLSGSYVSTHRVKTEKDGQAFSGQHKMPDWAGGLYTYDGTVKGDEFRASYKSAMDDGTYLMTRVK